jgi:hypothetical protein
MIVYYEPGRVEIPLVVWMFDAEIERLYFLDTGHRWHAVSGPWGKGSLPTGQYIVRPAVRIDLTHEDYAERYKGWTDGKGFAWFADLEPSFECERSGFEIHPDGGVPGTKGCIGLKHEDTTDVFELLQTPGVLMVV